MATELSIMARFLKPGLYIYHYKRGFAIYTIIIIITRIFIQDNLSVLKRTVINRVL